MNETQSTQAAENLRISVAAVFSPDGALAHSLPGYEPREGQHRMAEAVATVIEQGGTLLAEAGTGTGKTLAYLVPAILSGHRVLVSTGTKNLQEQIFFKDLPVLERTLGVAFKATLMKGRSNYLCLHRWENFKNPTNEPSERPEPPERQVFIPLINAWANKTKTGDRAELRDLPEDLPLWKDVAADAETCLGVECPHYGDCFVTRMRQQAAEADVVIVNHHLLCADASVRSSAFGEVIPGCATLVVDEAHQLEDVATQYFGKALSNYRVDDLVRDAQRLVSGRHLGKNGEEILNALSRVAERSRLFFNAVGVGSGRGAMNDEESALDQIRRPPSRREEARIRYSAGFLTEHDEAGAMLVGALEGLEAVLALTQQTFSKASADERDDTADLTEILATLARRAGELRSDLRFLLRAEDADYVYYLDVRGRGIFLRASPVDVSQIIQDALFDRMRSVVLTSATLAVDGSFSYVKNRLGIRSAAELCVASEFDFARQTILYLPRKMPAPKSPAFSEAVAGQVLEILHRTRGRAFVLFTSYAVLRAVKHVLEPALPYPILSQGDAPRSTLLDQFRSTPNAVLLATSSFWQGVDVVGESLSCVIIDKLPFASPSDPIVAARIEATNARGGDGFADYQVPLAMLALHQGLGRLIRHRNDRGVLAILDPRLRTMGYGARFLAALPPAPVTYDLDAVRRFFI